MTAEASLAPAASSEASSAGSQLKAQSEPKLTAPLALLQPRWEKPSPVKPRPKPESDGDRPGLFVHSMTLQQITYMGVLESVDLKQKNYPFRKKFEEFYADFELLSPRFAQLRYY